MKATFAALAVGALAVSGGQSQALRPSPGVTALYAAVGAELTRYEVDADRATLTRRESVTLPANVQEAAIHPSRQYLYVAWSNGGASFVTAGAGSGPTSTINGLTTFRIDPASGALIPLGQAAPLPSRAIHVSVDVPGEHILTAFNDPSGLNVHRLRPDGTVGAEVAPAGALDAGIYAHYVRATPSNRNVILVTRGNNPTAARPEDPGALKIFDYKAGVLANRSSIAPQGGFGFQARHLDFHPSRPWMFLTLERQNKIQMYRVAGEGLESTAIFTKDTLADPRNVRPGQTTSSIHVHPGGRFVYVGNRAAATTSVGGVPVWVGGENSIAVFAIDADTGEPTLLQNVDTRGIYPRTFALEADGRILVVGNQVQLSVREGPKIVTVPAALSVFRVGGDGRLDFARKYDVEVETSRNLFWIGMVSLP